MEGQSLFALAPELLGAVLPKRIKLTDEDESRIRLPDWRYVEIEDEVLELYRELDVRFVPLDPLAMAQALGYGPIPYRAFGQVIYPMLEAASADALTIWISGQNATMRLHDDARNRTRPARASRAQQAGRDRGQPFCGGGALPPSVVGQIGNQNGDGGFVDVWNQS